jgi:hypothetical protein
MLRGFYPMVWVSNIASGPEKSLPEHKPVSHAFVARGGHQPDIVGQESLKPST